MCGFVVIIPCLIHNLLLKFTDYPDGCTTLNGRHTVECLNNLWKRVGCVEVGDKYPEKQSSAILYTMKNTALTSLETDMKSSKTSADTGSKPEQLNCYGIGLPDNCLSFYGPYSIECLNSIWNIRGCLNKGTKAPSKLNPSEKNSLDALNLKALDQHMLEYRTEADSGNSQKQTECFGIVFYENCATFYGPHSMECLISTWENVGCRVNGVKYPPKLKEFELEPLVDMTLVEMDAAMKVSKIMADQGEEQHQLNCYGLAFPENCPIYNGPHSVDCLTTIWNEKGCRNDGTHAPVKLPTSEQDVLVAYNLNQLLDYVINKKSLADSGDNVGQLECFGTVFPDGCTTYNGPHTMECLIGVWKHVDCKDRGEEYPPKLSTAEADTLKYLSLPMLIENRQAVKTAADGGDATQQTNCYGVVFDGSCTSFTGPHSVECLTGIWESKGCLSEGTKAPVKLRNSERNALDLLNLKTVEVNFETVRTEADGGDADKVLECYGIVYPENCNSYRGPHSIDCLITIWEEVDCKVKGQRYPGDLSSSAYNAVKNTDLRSVREDMEETKSSADRGNDDNQMSCYGLVFPENCETYYGPHSLYCLTTIWESKGCLSEGSKAPDKLNKADIKAFNLMNVDEVVDHIETIKSEADGGNVIKGEECYGGVFPENCETFNGPHSIDCLITIWKEAGCDVNGFRYPNNLAITDADNLKNMDLTALKENMEGVKSAADNGNDDQRLNCYGIVFPENCDGFYGPHSMECLTTIWESKGCLGEGTKAPVKLTPSEKQSLDLLNLIDVGNDFETLRIGADGGDKDKGLKCYGIDFPENCNSYNGPHSINCLITIWEEVGCKFKGLRYPGVLTNADANTLKNMNLRDVRANMEGVKSAADNGNDNHQLNCYGTVFPNNCASHDGPHSVECLTTIWESKGCSSEGTKAPIKLDSAEKGALDLLNLE
uniref:uncharacterized protein LOC108950586 isoform X2 n=1 Tax=Ciona intestinalis TaxID=7719 RepID=UPI000EF4CDCE|nr:uncharacterized protein LOC108950586 isoform X2 [Ciona intestinalis]|eukprot:XP_026695288.1 uncharacterized protein LOC108950586 isoform X2 [Ciona intestinalis]